jgi:hypothetical protein
MATKYGSKKVTLDGHVFDSVIESRYYTQLKWAQEHKTILFFRLQPRYLLQEAFEKNGKKFRKIDYIADFEVHHCDGSIETIDVKGMETEAFKIKRKLFEKKYPHKLSLITYSKEWGGWFELDKLKKLRKEADQHAKQIEAKAKVTKGNRSTKKGQA